MIVYVTLLAYLENRDELSVVQFSCYIRQAFELKRIQRTCAIIGRSLLVAAPLRFQGKS